LNLFRKKAIDGILEEASRHTIIDGHRGSLNRTLTTRDLTALGIAAVIGAGIFGTIGTAAAEGGPAVSMLFVFTAVACGFCALCYAEFASMIPVSGSAYTYAYASFGELMAWIIGWDLLMEYAIGNIAVAISWSDYFTGLMSGLGFHIPEYFTMDFLSAHRGFDEAQELLAQGKNLQDLSPGLIEAYNAWSTAPVIGSLHVVADLPALMITAFITYLVYIGIRESRNASNIMVLIKLGVIGLVITVGAFYVRPENWSPFAPNGLTGVMSGVSAVFFAYIGFDAISTTAEECVNPQRDLPRGMFYSLAICTVLYVLITFILTGMVNYRELAVGDPLAYIFKAVHLDWISGIVAASAIVAMASVLLVFQLGQPRIWMSMSRDGLLPKIFSRIHPKFKTPSFSTILTGFVVAVPALFMNLKEVTDLTSIGTLFAFVLVCGGILILELSPMQMERKFKIPYLNGKYFVPLLFAAVIFIIIYFYPEKWNQFFFLKNPDQPQISAWEALQSRIPMILFILLCVGLTVLSVMKNLSLIPVLGLVSCFYLMTELHITNWFRFGIWLVVGLIIYFTYSYRNSHLAKSGD